MAKLAFLSTAISSAIAVAFTFVSTAMANGTSIADTFQALCPPGL